MCVFKLQSVAFGKSFLSENASFLKMVRFYSIASLLFCFLLILAPFSALNICIASGLFYPCFLIFSFIVSFYLCFWLGTVGVFSFFIFLTIKSVFRDVHSIFHFHN